MKIDQAIQELRKEKKRKFVQTVDLIINLQNFDVRKEAVNTFIPIPNPSPKTICGFLTRKSNAVDTIIKEEFDRYKTESDLKRLAKKYDFFIATAPLMGLIATKFGRVFGPMGKMPSPQAGIIPMDSDNAIAEVVEKMKKLVRIKSKEKSLKIPVGKEDMTDKELKENVESVITSVENALPRRKDNVKNVMIKLTMSKPIRLGD
ncbi:MAG: hypothetical protein Q7S33_00015 [Nanoarchaeota archaeon]|nr:hypothetical protein [Nanoarchaeota archaeon]